MYQFICREVSTISTPSVALQHPHGNSSSSSSSSGYRIHSGNMMTSKPAPTSVQQSHMGVRPQVPHYMTMARSGIPENKIVFKSSPFYKDIQVLSPARLCIGKEPRDHFCERTSRRAGDTECGREGAPFMLRDRNLGYSDCIHGLLDVVVFFYSCEEV